MEVLGELLHRLIGVGSFRVLEVLGHACLPAAVDVGGEQSSIPVDQDLLCGLLGSGGVVGPFDEFAVLELRAGADERHEMGRVDRPPA